MIYLNIGNTWSVRSFLVISTFFLLLWVTGLFLVLFDSKPKVIGTTSENDHIHQKSLTSDERISILALGDSITRGTGDATGKGYVGYVREELEKRVTKNIQFMNLAISGLRSDGLRQQVTKPEVQRQIALADVIFISIGGNDLFQGGETLLQPSSKNITSLQNRYTENVNVVFKEIREINQRARIYLIGLYNPFSDLEAGKESSRIVQQWNTKSEEVTLDYSYIVFVPTYDIFQLDLDAYIYSDRFHPNTEGHKKIAYRLTSILPW